MPEERRLSITSSSHLAPDDVAQHTFGTVRKGFDPTEVRAYLDSVATALRGVAERERQLQAELSEARHRAANPVLDEATLTAALGAETARVLHSAHEAATDLVARAEEEADRLLTSAHAEIEERRAKIDAIVEERTAEAEAAATVILEQANARAGVIEAHAEEQATTLVERTKEECRSMVDEAQQLRARVLSDLSRRRKVLHAQIEQLRAGRERLSQTVEDVKRSVNAIADDLAMAEDNARLAAERAAREAASRPDTTSADDVAAELIAQESTDSQLLADLTARPARPPASAADGSTANEHAEGAPVADVDAVFAKMRAARSVPEVAPQDAPGSTSEGAATSPEGSPSDDASTGDAPGAEKPSGSPAPSAKSGRSRKKTTTTAAAATAATATAAATTPAEASSMAGDGTPESANAPSPHDAGATPRPGDDQDGAAVPAVTGVGAPSGARAEEAEGKEADGEGPPEASDPLVLRRDELVRPIATALGRKIKRSLQDAQNELLDALRSSGTEWSIDLLGTEDEQCAAVAASARPTLEEAAAAGRTFAGRPEGAAPKSDDLDAVASDLAESVFGALRKQLADDDHVDRGDAQLVADHVGAAFREWKGERIDRLATDHVIAAFSLGTLAATAEVPDALLRWTSVAVDGGAPCPDCEDNGLAEGVAPGAEYPTGHLRPPVHPGCRCLVAPVAT